MAAQEIFKSSLVWEVQTLVGIEGIIFSLVQKKAARVVITHYGRVPFNNSLHWYRNIERKVKKAILVVEKILLQVVAFQEKND